MRELAFGPTIFAIRIIFFSTAKTGCYGIYGPFSSITNYDVIGVKTTLIRINLVVGQVSEHTWYFKTELTYM